jgi:hypothetical protein
MPMWAWIVIGAGAVLGLSVLVGLAVGTVLGSISREVSELLEIEPWSSAPLTQEKTAAARA